MATVKPDVREMSDEEAAELLDEQARRYLGLSGAEFLRRWDAGEFADRDEPDVIRVANLIPLVR